ncbi:MAG: tetracycline resistance MFS efflux pump [Gemmatimonadetes bacterium]|nr:MAG: tetracycline resistance MFS efflux pump [Gemmatimonadota bacterium]
MRRFVIIFFTVLIDLIGFGIILPILPFYAQRFGAAGLGYGGVIGVFSLMQFVATALLGKLSDRIGRRPVLLTTMLVNAVGYTLFAFAGSYWVLFLSRVVSGFAGGNISAAQAYMADITTPAERSRGMGMVGAAFGIGFSLGPAIGGFAHHWGGDAAPGLVAVGLSLANFVSAYFILPESLKHELRVKRPILDMAHIGDALARPRLRPLMAVWALVPLAFAGYTVALPLRAAAALGWQEREMAILFTIIGVTAASVQGYFFGKIVRRVGERTLVIAGTFGMALAIAVVPFLPSSALLYGWTFVLAVSNSVFAPAATGLVSVYADPNEQGTVLGAAQAIAALGRTAGPPLIGTVYDLVSPITSFLLAGVVMVLAGLAAFGLASVTHHAAGQAPPASPVPSVPLPDPPPSES